MRPHTAAGRADTVAYACVGLDLQRTRVDVATSVATFVPRPQTLKVGRPMGAPCGAHRLQYQLVFMRRRSMPCGWKSSSTPRAAASRRSSSRSVRALASEARVSQGLTRLVASAVLPTSSRNR
jgi:hypothetical protein